jgi:hypothetical protein
MTDAANPEPGWDIDRTSILSLAEALERAELIEAHSGDREPGRSLSARGKAWVIDGLRLLARLPNPRIDIDELLRDAARYRVLRRYRPEMWIDHVYANSAECLDALLDEKIAREPRPEGG